MTNSIKRAKAASVERTLTERRQHRRIAHAFEEAAANSLQSGSPRVFHCVSVTLPGFALDVGLHGAGVPSLEESISGPTTEAVAWLQARLVDVWRGGNHVVVVGTTRLNLTVEMFPFGGMQGVVHALVPTLRLIVCGPSTDQLENGLQPYRDPLDEFDPLLVVRPVDELWLALEHALQAERIMNLRMLGTLRPAWDSSHAAGILDWLQANAPPRPFVFGIGPDYSRLRVGTLADLASGALFRPAADVRDAQSVDSDGSKP